MLFLYTVKKQCTFSNEYCRGLKEIWGGGSLESYLKAELARWSGFERLKSIYRCVVCALSALKTLTKLAKVNSQQYSSYPIMVGPSPLDIWNLNIHSSFTSPYVMLFEANYCVLALFCTCGTVCTGQLSLTADTDKAVTQEMQSEPNHNMNIKYSLKQEIFYPKV